MSIVALLSSIILATSAIASPLIDRQNRFFNCPAVACIGIKLQRSFAGTSNFVLNDRARFQAFLAGSQGKSMEINATDGFVPTIDFGLLPLVEVSVGEPPTLYQLIVDTGSSNTFVGAEKPYTPTSSSKNTSDKVAVSYGSGSFSGFEFNDDVILGNTIITSQSIGIASQTHGFNGVDGILGIGPDSLTVGTLQDKPQDTIPTITDNLEKQNKITTTLVGISIPLTSNEPENAMGTLNFGTIESDEFTGEISFVPITQKSPSSEFWGIDQSISYGDNKTQILTGGAGIVDTGTTLLYLASDAFQAYVQATGAVMDQHTNMLKIDNPDSLKSLFFNIGGRTFEFTANAQIWPRFLNTEIGGDSSSTYLIVQDNGTPSGQGFDFINGFTFLQRFYAVFDTTNSRVGFATSNQTEAISN